MMFAREVGVGIEVADGGLIRYAEENACAALSAWKGKHSGVYSLWCVSYSFENVGFRFVRPDVMACCTSAVCNMAIFHTRRKGGN